ADGNDVIAGCAEVGAVDGDVSVSVAGEPRVQLSVPALRTTLDSVPAQIEVQVTDADGDEATGIAVRWGVSTMDGAGAGGEALSTERGRARIDIPPPDAAGPVAIDLAARWQRSPLPPVAAFSSPAIADTFTFEAITTVPDLDA